jgi:uncharacterized protein YbjT (DUF2867 family)
MSILLLAPPPGTADAVIARLVSQGDEVRVIETDSERADRWKALGARVALGSAVDADLIERAAQDARTLVLFDVHDRTTDLFEAAIAGASGTSVDRLILVGDGLAASCLQVVRGSGLDYVFLRAPRQRDLLRRRRSDPAAVAEAVDAADDLAGHPKLELDLSDPAAGRALGLCG